MMIVEIDGNDGVGKTTCINILKQHFGDDIEFKDRGALTLATDSDEFNKEKGVCYILLDCSVEERAARRYRQNIEKGIQSTYEEVLEGIKERHRLETEREIAPLIQAPDAVYVDSTGMTIEEEVQAVIKIIEEKRK